MNVFDKFFRKFAYKFNKGYPDMKNEQDILLLESLVSKILGEEIILEKALEWIDLSDASRKYYRLTVIDDKIKKGEPFKLENGKEEVNLKKDLVDFSQCERSFHKFNDNKVKYYTGCKDVRKKPVL